jgi:hypothetical protein
VVPLAVAQGIIVKFLTNENVKHAEILTRLRVLFGYETLSRAQVYDWSKSFKRGRKCFENKRRLRLLQGKLTPAIFGILKASY